MINVNTQIRRSIRLPPRSSGRGVIRAARNTKIQRLRNARAAGISASRRSGRQRLRSQGGEVLVVVALSQSAADCEVAAASFTSTTTAGEIRHEAGRRVAQRRELLRALYVH